jgi:hypothetical protein
VIDALVGERRDPVRAVGEVAGDDQLVDPPVGQVGREPLRRPGGSEQLSYLAGDAQGLDMDAAGRSGQLAATAARTASRARPGSGSTLTGVPPAS